MDQVELQRLAVLFTSPPPPSTKVVTVMPSTSTAPAKRRRTRPRPDPSALLRGHLSAISCLHFLPSTPLLASGDESGLLRLWHTSLEESILSHRSSISSPLLSVTHNPAAPHTLTLHYKSGRVSELHLARDDAQIDLAAWHVRRVTALSGPPSQGAVAPLLPESFCRLDYLREHVFAAPVDDGQSIGLFDTRTSSTCHAATTFPCPTTTRQRSVHVKDARTDSGMLMALARASDGARVLAGYEDGGVAVWDVRGCGGASAAPVAQTGVGDEAVMCLAAAPQGNVAVAGGAFGFLAAVADVEGAVVRVVRRAELKEKGIGSVRWRDDGRVVASAGWDGRVRVWEGRRTREGLLRRVGSLKWHEGAVGCVAFGEAGVLASGGKDRTIAVWRGVA